MLEVKNLKKVYKTKNGASVNALDGVSLRFPETGMVFLLGKSGSGKSTLLNICGGLDSPTDGEIIVKGRSSAQFAQSDFDSYRNTFIGFIFQEYNILNEFSVEDNIALALELQGKSKDKAAIAMLLDEVDLTGFAKRKPNTLSGGQKQRIAIARALIKEPEIIMADEPTGALDSNTGKQVFDTLKKLSENKLVIVVSHDRDFAEQYGDRIIELMDGKVLSDVSKVKEQQAALSTNVNSVDNVLVCKRGSDLTEADFEKIKIFLKNSPQDVIIAGNETDIKNFKKVSRINEDGTKEVFRNTEKLGGKNYSPEESRFIRSKLPIKHAFKIGISSLRSKPFRLCFTALLCTVAFVLFGLLSTLNFYDSHNTFVQTMQDGGMSVMQVEKNYKTKVIWYANGKEEHSYESYTATAFTTDELESMTATLGADAFGGVASSASFNLRQNDSSYYISTVNTIATLPESNSIRGSITGSYPTAKNEIAISSYLANVLVICKAYDSNGVSMELSSTDELIGKKIILSNYTYKITGIIDSGEIPEEYSVLKENAVENRSLINKYAAFLGDGLHQIVFVTEERLLEIASEDYNYVDGVHNYTNIVAAFQTDGKYEFPEYNNANYLTADAIGENQIFAITSDKKTLSKGEAVISASLFANIAQEAYYDLAEDCGEDYTRMEKYYASAEIAIQIRDGGLYVENPDTEKYELVKFTEKELNDKITALIAAVKRDGISLTVGIKMYDYNNNGAVGELYTFNLTGVYAEKNATSGMDSLILADEDFELLWNQQKKTVDYYCEIESQYVEPNGAIYDKVIVPFEFSSEAAEEYWKLYSSADWAEDGSKKSLTGNFVSSLQMIDETVGEMSTVFLYVGLAMAVFAALLLSNFISASITQKKREIGILRAVGARSTDVFKIFFSESFTIGIICVVLSTVASVLLCNVLNTELASELGASLFVFGAASFMVLIAVALVTVVVATFIPVSNAAKKKPVDSIRSL